MAFSIVLLITIVYLALVTVGLSLTQPGVICHCRKITSTIIYVTLNVRLSLFPRLLQAKADLYFMSSEADSFVGANSFSFLSFFFNVFTSPT